MRPHDIAKKYKFFDVPYRFAIRVKNHYVYKFETKKYNKWIRTKFASQDDLEKQAKVKFKKNIKFSFVIPLYNTPLKYLEDLVDSIKKQSYPNWEICFSDGGGPDSSLVEVINNLKSSDNRIKCVISDKPLQISDNTNLALQLVDGDYIIFGDHDDLFEPNALFECAKVINDNENVDLIYSDEDKIDAKGKKYMQPAFKPDFNLDMLRSTNYICHLTCVKSSLQKEVGGFRSEFDGAQDYDFVLRCVSLTDKIFHIPKILYHWRAHKYSTAKNQNSKTYAFDSGMEVLKDYYYNLGINAKVSNTYVEDNLINGIYRTHYIIDNEPLVSIIIPNQDHVDDLNKCINSIFAVNNYNNFELIIVENNSTDKETFNFYKKLEKNHKNIKIINYPENGFNFSRINNYAVKESKGDFILFLNNDTEIVNPETIYELVSNCMRPEIGAVGAKLIYPDHNIQHVGVIIGMCGVASHCFINLPETAVGYGSRITMVQNYNACTAACLMVKKHIFEKIGGFDEKFVVAYNDIDLCLRIREKGYLVTYTPYALLIHFESKSRGYENTPEKAKRFNEEINLFKERWKEILSRGDEYFNPNLSLTSTEIKVNFEQ